MTVTSAQQLVRRPRSREQTLIVAIAKLATHTTLIGPVLYALIYVPIVIMKPAARSNVINVLRMLRIQLTVNVRKT